MTVPCSKKEETKKTRPKRGVWVQILPNSDNLGSFGPHCAATCLQSGGQLSLETAVTHSCNSHRFKRWFEFSGWQRQSIRPRALCHSQTLPLPYLSLTWKQGLPSEPLPRQGVSWNQNKKLKRLQPCSTFFSGQPRMVLSVCSQRTVVEMN